MHKQGIYTAIAVKFVDTDADLGSFLKLAKKVHDGTRAAKGEKILQSIADMEELYLACHRVTPT